MANKEEGLKKQRFETLKDKHMMLWQLAYRMDEIPIIAESTKLQQAELLAQEILPVCKSSNKIKLEEDKSGRGIL